jgi:putative ABC transport system permease protein
MALGAAPADIQRLSFRQGLSLLGLSVCVGLAASFALASTMSKLLVDISAFDPIVYLLVVVLLSGVTLLACYIPARRASKVDPMVALRYE